MQKYIIGKPRRVLAIVNILVWMPLAILFIYCEIYFRSPIVNGIFLGGIIITINLLVAAPSIYSSGMWWSIDSDTLKYSSFRNFISRIKAFYLPGYHTSYYLTLNVREICKIDLGWHDVPYPPFGKISHPITFTIEMKDGSIVELEVLYTRESKKFVKACNYIKSLGIEVNDRYDLLTAINDPRRMVAQYIDDIERGGHHD